MSSRLLFASAVWAAVYLVFLGAVVKGALIEGVRYYSRSNATMQHVFTTVSSGVHCKELCHEDIECVAMTFDEEKLLCHLFFGTHYKGGDTASGFVSWSNRHNYQIRNICLNSATRIVENVNTYSHCASECRQDLECSGSTYHIKEKKCSIHNTLDGLTEDGDCYTWTRYNGHGFIKQICLTKGYSEEDANTVKTCRTDCLKDDKCRACGYNEKTKKCTKATRTYSVTTGGPECSAFIPYPQIDLRHGLCLTKEYEAIQKLDVIDCYETCGGDSRCKAMTFNNGTKNCQLLDDKFKSAKEQNKDCETWISSKVVPYVPLPPYGLKN